MAGRPRSITDQRLLDAVAVAVGKVGPGRLTLTDVAREAGVSTGVLVQRFGTKRGLLLAFLQAADPAATMRAAYEQTLATGGDPVAGLVEALVALAGPQREPAEFANHLAFLHLELADDEFRQGLARFDTAVNGELTAYVTAAIECGRIDPADPAALVEALTALFYGVQISWAIHRRIPLDDAVRGAMFSLLGPRAHSSI